MFGRKHGSPEDRGSADAYFGRPKRPHFNQSLPNGSSMRIGREGMTREMIDGYNRGYDNETDRKVWDDGPQEDDDEQNVES